LFRGCSSSAHLILLPLITDWPDQGLAFDVAMNTATWLAVVLYFRKDLLGLSRGFLRTLKDRTWQENTQGQLAWMLLAATVPVALAGFLAHDTVAHKLRTAEVIAWSSIFWGFLLWVADRRPGTTDIQAIGWRAALFVGLAQAIALVPGTSRSGITITAGLFMGLTRTAAARFSFLLAVVVGALAGGREAIELAGGGTETPWLAVSLGFVAAFFSAYLAIHYFLKLITRFSMTPFVVYRVALGAALLIIAS
jgi:undecaprenyl-diphosphatase